MTKNARKHSKSISFYCCPILAAIAESLFVASIVICASAKFLCDEVKTLIDPPFIE